MKMTIFFFSLFLKLTFTAVLEMAAKLSFAQEILSKNMKEKKKILSLHFEITGQ